MASPVSPRARLLVIVPLLLAATASSPLALAQTPPPSPAKTPTRTPAPAPASEDADIFSLGQELFDTYAPPEIKRDFAFPTREQWDAFAARLEKTRETGSLADLAAYEPEARAALVALRVLPEYSDYADWLSERLDEIVVAREATAPKPPTPTPTPTPLPTPTPIPGVPLPTPTPTPSQPRPPVVKPTPTPSPSPQPSPVPGVVRNIPTAAEIPMYDLWVGRLRERPRPARADEFLPQIKKVFADEGVPTELAWLAETESTFNPSARSPAGARGLFQLMPVTAKAQGLSLWPLDERTDPLKSARAAATLLHRLHGLFDSWPLALAAYNAGEGKVRRTLKAEDGKTFADIADALPTETRLYVPRVLATMAVREGIAPSSLPRPR